MVQKALLQKVLDKMALRSHTQITASGISISLFPTRHVMLSDLLILDQQCDTLLYSEYVRANFSKLSTKNITISGLYIDHFRVNVLRDSTGKEFRYQSILDSLKNTNTTDTSASSLNFKLDHVLFSRGSACYSADSDRNNDWNLSNINAEWELQWGDSSRMNIALKSLSFLDPAHLEITKGHADLTVDKGYYAVKDLQLQTPRSQINISQCTFQQLARTFPEDIPNEYLAQLVIEPSSISSLDLKPFSALFQGPEIKVKLHSRFNFSPSSIKMNSLQLAFNQTQLYGNLEIKNYKKLKNASISSSIDSLITNKEDVLAAIHCIANQLVANEWGELGIIKFFGNVQGPLSNLETTGKLTSSQGTLLADVSIQSVKQVISLSGSVTSECLNLGEITLGRIPIDSISMNVQLVGHNMNTDSIESDITGKISRLYYNRYLYKNISVNGQVNYKHFIGEFAIKEKNGSLKFQGDADLTGEQKIFNFTLDAKDVNLYNFHLINKYPKSRLSFNMSSDLNSSDFKNIDGAVEVTGLRFYNGKDTAAIDLLLFESNKNDINIYSDIVNGSLSGTYSFDHLGRSIENYLSQFNPNLFSFQAIKQNTLQEISYNNFQYNLVVDNITPILKALHLNSVYADSILIDGYLNEEANDFKTNIRVANIDWSDKLFSDELALNISNDSSRLKCDLNLVNLRKEKYTLKSGVQLSLKNQLSMNSLTNQIQWFYQDSLLEEGNINLYSYLEKNLDSTYIGNDKNWKITTHTDNNAVVIKGENWFLNFKECVFTPEQASIDSLQFKDSSQCLLVTGIASAKEEDHLDLNLDRLSLGYFSDLLGVNNAIDVEGDASGSLQVHQVFHKPFAYCNLEVGAMKFNQQTFDRMELNTEWVPDEERIHIRTKLISNEHPALSAEGYYDLNKNWIELDANLQELHLLFLRKYLQGVIQDLDGKATGEISVVGPINDIDLIGSAYIDSAHLNLDLLKTSATFSDSIQLTSKGLVFPKITLHDPEGNEAVFSGTIDHNAFSDMKFNLRLYAMNYKILGTTEKDNPVYYGTAYTTGLCTIKGDENLVTISCDATTNPHTHLYIPLDQGENVSSNSFITFVNKHHMTPLELAIQEYKHSKEVSHTKVALDLMVHATDDAKVELIFEKTMGNIIRGHGTGNIRMVYNPDAEIKMYGNYVISSGDYLLTTLQALVNKKFDIKKNSSITWSGSPYDADINLDAEYKLKTSISSLLAGKASTDNIRQRVNVVCGMNLSGRLTQPTVKFDISLPYSDSETQRLVSDLLGTTDDLSKQVAYLLLTNQFYTPDQLNGTITSSQETSQMAAITVSELLSNQLSSMMSKMNDNVAMGVYYRPSDATSSSEMEVQMSTQLLNNRVSINGNVGYSDQTVSSNNFIGDFDVEVKLIKSGKLLLKTYTHTNDYVLQNTSPTTQGIGLVFKEEFNSFDALMASYFHALFGTKQEKLTPKNQERKDKEQKSKEQEDNTNHQKE